MVKGICILQVVAIHTYIPYFGTGFLVSITIPCFFLISGILFKPDDKKLFRSFDSLVIPYIVIFFTYNIYKWLIFNQMPSVPRSIWFLLSLYGTIILYYGVCKISTRWLERTILSIILSLIGYVFSFYTVPLPKLIAAAFSMVIFFHAGNVLGKFDVNILMKKYGVIFIILSIIIYYFFNDIQILSVSRNEYKYNYIVTLFLVFFCIPSVFLYSKLLENIRILSVYILYVGRYSLVVLCMHIFVLLPMTEGRLDNFLSFLIILILTPVTIEFVKRVCPCLFGLKPFIGSFLYDRLLKDK